MYHAFAGCDCAIDRPFRCWLRKLLFADKFSFVLIGSFPISLLSVDICCYNYRPIYLDHMSWCSLDLCLLQPAFKLPWPTVSMFNNFMLFQPAFKLSRPMSRCSVDYAATTSAHVSRPTMSRCSVELCCYHQRSMSLDQ